MNGNYEEKLKRLRERKDPDDLATVRRMIPGSASENIADRIAKQADSSYLTDFVAGFDPTGVSTFRNAMGNEENHGMHKAVGDVGGFVGGSVVGGLVPAALMGGAALALRKKPEIADEFMTMAKGSLDIFRPKRIKNYLASFKDIPEFKRLGSDLKNNADDLLKGWDSAKGKINPEDTSKAEVIKKLMSSDKKESMEKAKSVKDKLDGLSQTNDELNVLNKKMSDTYYGGRPIQEGASRAFTAIGGLGTAVLGGAINGASSHLQYDTAINERTKREKELLGKTASKSIADRIMKMASAEEDSKALKKGIKTKNINEKKVSMFGREPDNFRKNTKVKSSVTPEFYEDKMHYNIKHVGGGRRNQLVESSDNYKQNIPNGASGEELQAAVDQFQADNRLPWTDGAIGAGIGAVAVPSALYLPHAVSVARINRRLGSALEAFPSKGGAAIGTAVTGLIGAGLGGSIGAMKGKYDQKNNYFDNLPESDREVLANLLRRRAAVVSQDANKGSNLKYTNVYYG